jgi:hypothetical protein
MAFVFWNIFHFFGYKNSFTLGRGVRLDDQGALPFLIFQEILKVESFIRGDPGFRKEIILIWKDFLHQFEVLCKVIFPGDQVGSWEVIDDLKRLHFHEHIG